MRLRHAMVDLVRDCMAAGKPVAAICHGPSVLINANVLRGKTLTCWPSIAVDVKNAGGRYVDRPVVEDGNLITSRKVDDLQAFNDAIVRQLDAAHRHGAPPSSPLRVRHPHMSQRRVLQARVRGRHLHTVQQDDRTHVNPEQEDDGGRDRAVNQIPRRQVPGVPGKRGERTAPEQADEDGAPATRLGTGPACWECSRR